MKDENKNGRNLKVTEAAEIARVHVNTIYNMVGSGKLPSYRMGIGRGTIRIREADLQALMRIEPDEDQPEGDPCC